MTLRDALADAMVRAGIPEAYITTEAGDGHYIHTPRADAILSDPAFRAALVEIIAEALQEECDSDACREKRWDDHGPHDFQAEFVVDYITGGEAWREAHADRTLDAR